MLNCKVFDILLWMRGSQSFVFVSIEQELYKQGLIFCQKSENSPGAVFSDTQNSTNPEPDNSE
jgi:hypothetical protein